MERFDGSGYPDGLCGDAIPRNADILRRRCIRCALTSNGPYKKPMPCRGSTSLGRWETRDISTRIASVPSGDRRRLVREGRSGRRRGTAAGNA
ncbi:MAG: hypothetical protein IPI44_09595, partial [Sulfuritalea sp.]|nr:hypothetical protein [Sulfuritalea sp.]